MRSLAELTPAAASSSIEQGGYHSGQRGQGPQVDGQPRDGGLGNAAGPGGLGRGDASTLLGIVTGLQRATGSP